MKLVSFFQVAFQATIIHGLLGNGFGQTYEVVSPEGQVALTVVCEAGSFLKLSAVFNGREVLLPETELEVYRVTSRKLPGYVVEIIHTEGPSYFDETYTSLWGFRTVEENVFTQFTLEVDVAYIPVNLIFTFRVYDNGIAFTYEVLPWSSMILTFREEHTFALPDPDATVWAARGWKDVRGPFSLRNLVEVLQAPPDRGPDCNSPVNVKFLSPEEIFLSFDEAAVINMNSFKPTLKGPNELSFQSTFRTSMNQIFKTPWRVINMAHTAGGLVESNIVRSLNQPANRRSITGRTFEEWVVPGLAMWDFRIRGAVAQDGMVYDLNMDTFKRLIDFSSERGIKYVIADDGWYSSNLKAEKGNLLNLNILDVRTLAQYARSKGVGLVLYVSYPVLKASNANVVLATYREWGVAGIKHGFVSTPRSVIPTVYKDMLEIIDLCAYYELVYIVHEQPKPSGWERTYPNILSTEYTESMLDNPRREGADPVSLTTLPFVQHLSAPVDRSSGMFDLDTYITREFCPRQIISTVMSQIAQGFVYYTGMWVLIDTDEAYMRKPDLFALIQEMIPFFKAEETWVEGEIGKSFIVTKKLDRKFITCGIASEASTISIDTSRFIPPRISASFAVRVYEDGKADGTPSTLAGIIPSSSEDIFRIASDVTRREIYATSSRNVYISGGFIVRGDPLVVDVAYGGGFCIVMEAAVDVGLPTEQPTPSPTTGRPTKSPTMFPTRRPTTSRPTKVPTPRPTSRPTRRPTFRPTKSPTPRGPTRAPTPRPMEPVAPTPFPTIPKGEQKIVCETFLSQSACEAVRCKWVDNACVELNCSSLLAWEFTGDPREPFDSPNRSWITDFRWKHSKACPDLPFSSTNYPASKLIGTPPLESFDTTGTPASRLKAVQVHTTLPFTVDVELLTEQEFESLCITAEDCRLPPMLTVVREVGTRRIWQPTTQRWIRIQRKRYRRWIRVQNDPFTFCCTQNKKATVRGIYDSNFYTLLALPPAASTRTVTSVNIVDQEFFPRGSDPTTAKVVKIVFRAQTKLLYTYLDLTCGAAQFYHRRNGFLGQWKNRLNGIFHEVMYQSHSKYPSTHGPLRTDFGITDKLSDYGPGAAGVRFGTFRFVFMGPRTGSKFNWLSLRQTYIAASRVDPQNMVGAYIKTAFEWAMLSAPKGNWPVTLVYFFAAQRMYRQFLKAASDISFETVSAFSGEHYASAKPALDYLVEEVDGQPRFMTVDLERSGCIPSLPSEFVSKFMLRQSPPEVNCFEMSKTGGVMMCTKWCSRSCLPFWQIVMEARALVWDEFNADVPKCSDCPGLIGLFREDIPYGVNHPFYDDIPWFPQCLPFIDRKGNVHNSHTERDAFTLPDFDTCETCLGQPGNCVPSKH